MKKDIKFEEAMTSLEDIVNKLDSGTLTLDESIEAFETATRLVKICTEKLDAAEQRVRLLVEDSEGTVSDVRFDKCDET